MAVVSSAATPASSTGDGYGVYVIELDKGANRHLGLPLDLGLPVVYVGQSWHPPEKRFRQHKAGGQFASKFVVRNGLRLRPDLYGHLDRVETKQEAEELEAAHAGTLAGLGFHAYFDGNLIRPDRTAPTPESEAMQTEQHVNTVSDFVDGAIFSVVTALNQPGQRPKATPRLVAELLGPNGRGCQIPLDVPIPDRGCFGYLNTGLILGRLKNLRKAGFLRATPDGHIFIPKLEGGLN